MKVKDAAWIITAACVIQILGYLYALPGHIGDPTWSNHAQFHLVLAWIWIVGLDAAIMALACGPLQKRDKATFWILIFLFICAQGGHFIASLIVPSGRPSEWWYDYALGTGALIFAIGLAVAWKAIFRPDAA
jgi:hypothetical protein